MSRKLWVFATVTLFGVSAVLTGIGLTRNAAACDDAAKKTAAATSSSSCCAKDGTSSASVDARKVHRSMIKSAVVAPGAAPILNVAAFGGMLAGGADCPPCDWCPEMTTASVKAVSAECASRMSTAASSGCTGKSAATTASYEAIPAGHPPIVNAGAGHPGCGSASAAKVASSGGCASKTASAAKVASSDGCASKTASVATVASSDDCCASKGASAAKVASNDNFTVKNASVTLAAGGEGCDKGSSASAAGTKDGAICCDSEKTASAAGSGEKCSSATTASLKGKVDEMPYRENKRVVLAGSYACGHCTLQKTEDCSPMLKTADGKVYPLLQNNHAKEMRSKEGKNLEVSATVKKVDGVKFLDVKSYKVM